MGCRTDSGAPVTPIRHGRGRRLSLALALLGLFGAAASPAADEAVSISFGTDVVPTGWLITGAGVTAAPATPVTIYPGFISFSSTGFPNSTFIPGASAAAFDGAWYADYSFAIPKRAQDIRFQFYDLTVDDRAVVLLNGSAIGNATIYGTTGTFPHQFGPGEAAEPFTFTQTTEGTLLGDGNPLFIIGSKDPRGTENVLRLSVNNVGSNGLPSPLGGVLDGTVVRLRAQISWTEDYQIRPYPNPLGNTVEVDDDPHGWYNAVDFQNGGVITVAQGGSLTNRNGARLVNTGVVQNSGQLILGGQYESLPYASLQNFGEMLVLGQVEELGAVVNTGQLTVNGGNFYYLGMGGGDVFSNPGLIDNQGIFIVSGDQAKFLGSSDADTHFVNRKTLLINGGAKMFESVNNSSGGRLTIGTEGFLGGYLLNTKFSKTVIEFGGSFAGGLTNEGDIEVSGGGAVLGSSLSGAPMTNSGTLSIMDGATLFVGNGTDLANDGGGIIWIGAGSTFDVRQSGSFHNQSGVLGVNGRASHRGLFVNNDTVAISGVDGEGIVRLSGLTYNGGTITVSDVGLLEIAAGARLEGPGSINVLHSNLVFNGLVSGNTVNCDQGGRLSGSGTILGAISMGSCALGPGNSPGTLTMDGVLEMSEDATVEMEIGSPDDYDRLVINGEASFAPGVQVNVTFVDGYLPDWNDDFAWLSGRVIYGRDALAYNVPYDGWQYGYYTDYGSGTGTTHLKMAAIGALDLGAGLQAGAVIGAGQVAYVEPTGPYTDYQNGGVFDDSGVVHNRTGSQFVNFGPASDTPGSLAIRAGAWFVNRGYFRNDSGSSIDNAGTFYNHATGELDNRGEFHNAAEGRVVNRGLVKNGGGAATIRNEGRFENRGEIVNSDSIVNRGEFLVASGASVHGEGGSYLQESGRTRVDGLLGAASIFIQGGTLGGNGRLAGNLAIVQAFGYEGLTTGTLDPGDPLAAGRLELTGDATLDGILHIDIASAALHDVLAVDGNVTGLDGTLEVALLDGFRPVLGETFDYLTARDSGAFAAFAHLLLPTLDPGLAWATRYLSDGAMATYRLEVVAAEVPAPATLALFGTGLAALAARARRRRAQAAKSQGKRA